MIKRKIKVKRNEKKDRRERVSEEREKGIFFFFYLSLRSTEIKLSVFVRARRKVDPRIASYAWVPKSWSFIKLHEVKNFLTLNIFILKAM